MAEPQVGAGDGEAVSLACFEVKGQVHAVDVLDVREIVRAMEVAPLPNAPRLIEGVIDLRGAVIPVVDLGRVLGLGGVEADLQARIVVIETDGLVLGLRVDAATDVLTLPIERLEPVPELATQAGYETVRQVVRREGEPPVMVLSLESLIEHVYRSAPVGVAGEGEHP